ncbi:MAG TPA: hypothetical protein VK525_15710 [Candidatus Saccharimonadales bacterium]|nr:hypothetical protein [Candidatus Saccharimonadales bacterium]
MSGQRASRHLRFAVLIVSFSALLSAFLISSPFEHVAAAADADPWSSGQALQPADLARELANGKQARPTVLYVGVRTLFNGGHIPGSSFHGTPSTEKGLQEMKAWADTLPRSTSLVIYCGCCPLDRCPNIRPAFSTLHEMGFANLRVLILPTSFAADWVEKGLPVEQAR